MHDLLRHSVAHLFRPGLNLSRAATGDLSISLDDDEHHLRRVLRVRDGELVSVADGAGAWVPCRYTAAGLSVDGEVQRLPAPATRLTVGFTPVKGERTDWTVEKLVEIGIDRVVVLAPTVRSVVRWDASRAGANADKLRRTALAAASQSRRVWLPEVQVGVALSSLATSTNAMATGVGLAVADPDGPALATTHHTVAVGPEGGFDPSEIGDFPRVGLGATILRAETAAVVAGALMVAHRGG